MNGNKLQKRLQKFPRYTFTVLCALAILAACLIDLRPFEEDLPKIFGIDKVVHFVMYFVLTYIFLWEYDRRQWRGDIRNAKKLFWLSLLVSCVYGGVVEYLQSLTSFRGMDEMDLVADILGAMFAYLFYIINILKPQKHDEKK